MGKAKLTYLQLCVFTPTDLDPVSGPMPQDEQTIWNAAEPLVYGAQAEDLPVTMYICPLTIPQNQIAVSKAGIVDLPALQLYAEYEDGSKKYYNLQKTVQDKLTGISWTTEDLRPYFESLLYNKDPTNPSLLCRLFPPLCAVGPLLWLGGAAVCAFQAVTTENKTRRLVFGAGAGVMGYEFYKKGGVDALKAIFK